MESVDSLFAITKCLSALLLPSTFRKTGLLIDRASGTHLRKGKQIERTRTMRWLLLDSKGETGIFRYSFDTYILSLIVF